MNERATTTTDCHFCLSDLDHCHGAAIVIDESVDVCSDDPDCELAAELHSCIVDDDLSDASYEIGFIAS